MLGAALGFVIFIAPRIEWHQRVRVRVAFHDVGGLEPGAGFVVAGRRVGSVESIVPAARNVVVTVGIDAVAAQRIRVPAVVFVSSRGVVSERYLEIAPPAIDARPLRDGDQLVGADPATLDSVLQRSLASMIAMRGFADAVQPELAALTVQLARLRAHIAPGPLAAALDELAAARDEAAQLPGIGNACTVIGQARETLTLARAVLDGLAHRADQLNARIDAADALLATRRDRIVAKLDAVRAGLRHARQRTDSLLALLDALEVRLAQGEGSLLKLLADPEFPEDMKELGKVLKRQPWRLLATPGD